MLFGTPSLLSFQFFVIVIVETLLLLDVHKCIIPEKMLVDSLVVFNGHCYECNHFSTVTISGADVCYTVHDKLLVLNNVNFVPKVVSSVWIGIKQLGSGGAALMMVQRVCSLKRLSVPCLTHSKSLRSQQSCHSLSTIYRAYLHNMIAIWY